MRDAGSLLEDTAVEMDMRGDILETWQEEWRG